MTALNIFILSFLLLIYLNLIKNNYTHRGSYIWLGILSGLLFLQRHDNIILLVLLMLHYIITAKDVKNKFTNLIIASGFALLVVLPWLVYSYIQFGTIAPTSAWAVPAVNHARWEDQYPGFWGLLHKSIDLIVMEFGYFITFSFIYYLIIISYLVLIIYYFRSNNNRNIISLVLTLGLFLWTLYLVNIGYRWYMRDWHLGIGLLINDIVFWYSIYIIFKSMKFRNIIIYIITATLVVFNILRTDHSLIRFSYQHQIEMMRGGQWMSNYPNTMFGVINCGIPSYFGKNNVIDLDGNMNISAYDAIIQRNLYEYCKNNNIHYILDYDIWINEYYKKLWGDDYIKRITVIDTSLDDNSVEYGGYYRIPEIKILYCLFRID